MQEIVSFAALLYSEVFVKMYFDLNNFQAERNALGGLCCCSRETNQKCLFFLALQVELRLL